MGRKFVCQWCKEKDVDENMQLILSGTQKKRYHLDGCYQAYQQEQEFKKQESKELDELVEVIKEVHGISVIPQNFYSFLQDIRNGNEMFGKIGKKKSKQGYRYSVIAETYKECTDSIEWAKQNKDFKDTTNMLKYTKAIVVNHIDEVAARLKRKEQQEQIKAEENIDQNYNYDIETHNHKDKKDELDISKYL